MTQPPNFLTFDIEEWYRVNYQGADYSPMTCSPGWMESFTDKLLDICAAGGCVSTFFVLGSVAEQFPQVVRRIAGAGHEIASHGCDHKAVSTMTPAEFAEDLRRSCGILESLTGRAVRGFRAPSFSVNRDTLPWYYDALESAGLTYSSSVFPGRTFLYGIPDFPRRVHRPQINGHRSAITEFPVTRVDFAGRTIGLYLRFFPLPFLRHRIRKENAAGNPAMLYMHPREIDPRQPRLALPWPQSFIHYFGLDGCEEKLRMLLRTVPGPFITIAGALDQYPEFSA